MSDYPDDIREKAGDIARLAGKHYISMGPMGFIQPIADALMAERLAQQQRAATILSAIADILSKRITDNATPELLNALADAIREQEVA